jgi:outer membrane usher protein FimD/PapC
MLMSADHVATTDGGSLTEVGVRTSLGRFSADLTHTQLNNFSSDFFIASSDPLKQRTRARLSGSVPLSEGLVIPVGLDVFREVTASGRSSVNAQGRLSLNLQNTSFTNALNLQSADGNRSTSGALQVHRRMAGIGLSSQLAYTLEPDSRLTSVAISADKSLSETARLNLGLVHSLDPRVTTLTAGYNRNFGSFGLGLSAYYRSNGEVGIGMQLFMAIGRDPRSGNWVRNWQPMAASGAVSARAFVDANMNGIFDIGEAPIEGAGFVLNGGSRHPVRTNADGMAYMSNMTPRQYADVALDTGTLEDPQWQVAKPGVRVLPRPGKVVLVDFPVVMTSEIDGTVYLEENGKTRGIGNALLELVNERGEVVTKERSAADGYYIVPAVKPGRYTLRLSAEQLRHLGLVANQSHTIDVQADGHFVNGIDFTLRAVP